MYWPGVIALWAAAAALFGSTFFYLQSTRGREGARAWARQLYALATFAIVMASFVLLFLILKHDFRLHYVYSYSDLSLPLHYLASTFWAGQEGSFLFWLLCGMLVGLPLIRYARHYEDRTLIVYNLAQISILLILIKQSPFRLLADLPPGQMPFDGQGLNPLLQNPWMTIHPPIMFLGYAATAVPFAFAIAALWTRRYDEWVKASLPWALLTVVTLGAAILLGGYWAYVTLGWGGYWGWDPVENSSLVPWLASAALVHGMLLQRARGRFRKLNFALAILSFVLVTYATFLTRSGVLADFSVHSFVDLGITGWLVFNLGFFLLLGTGMLLWRWREIPTQAGDEGFLSRTVFFVLAIAALLGTAGMVLLGTSAPLITRLAASPAQVGPDFYNRVTLPVGIFLAFLLAVVPYLSWRGANAEFRGRVAIAGGLAVAGTMVGFIFGAFGVFYLTFLFFALFAFFSNLLKTIDQVRSGKYRSAGGYLAHVGLGLMLAGIITSSAFDRTQKVVLPLGQGQQVLGYTLTFRGIEKPTPTSRDAMVIEVKDEDGGVYMARPRMFRNEKSNQIVANPDVRVRLTHDLYISPIEFNPGRPPEGNGLTLSKGQSAEVGGYLVKFDGFDMAGMHGDGANIAIGAKLLLSREGETFGVTPVLTSREGGFLSAPVGIPNANATVRLVSVNASAGEVRLEFEGLGTGVAKTAALRQGEQFAYRGVSLTFADFDLTDFAPDEGRINIGAVLRTAGTSSATVVPVFRSNRQGEVQYLDAALPGLDGVRVRLARMDPEAKTVQLAVIDPAAPADLGEPARFSADVSVKPMIVLLWTGLVVLLAGGILAMFKRGEEFSGAVAAPQQPQA